MSTEDSRVHELYSSSYPTKSAINNAKSNCNEPIYLEQGLVNPQSDGVGSHGSEADVLKIGRSSKSEDAPFHVFSKRHKWSIVYLVSLAGSFSPLSSNIYFPAITSISTDLAVGVSQVLLTITVYMVVQGISPSILGALSDVIGRRITFATTLAIYTVANLALAFTTNFPMLLVLRGVQAAGSAATISISTGVIADMAETGERGSFIGVNAGTRMMGQAIGPIIGGALNSAWGFRSIFWFLFCLSSLVLMLLLIFLPETQRQLAGNGSTPVRNIYKPLVYVLWPPKEWTHAKRSNTRKTPRISFSKTLVPLKHVFEKDIAVLLAWGALVYAVWSMVVSSTTPVLLRAFPTLTQWQIGLCFLPNGVGCVLGSICTGRLLDKTFKQVEAQYKEERGLGDCNIKKSKDFPFERARLPWMPYFSVAFIVAVALYGPSYELNDLNRYFAVNLIASLGLQFLIAFMATAIFSINSTLLVDCFPDGSAGATATNNLCRCLLGAAGVSGIQPLIDALKVRNAFLVVSAIVTAFSPLVWVQWKHGSRWRMERERVLGI